MSIERARYALLVCIFASLERTAESRKVCYKEVGCFDNRRPFNFAARRLPLSPRDVGTQFRLFTRRNTTGPGELLQYNGEKFDAQSSFDPQLPVKFIVHGFSRGPVPWMVKMKDAFLEELPSNVILVYWTKGARMPWYFRAAANSRLVGRQMALLIRKLVRSGSSLDKVHLIGLSLGAHVCGFAGSELNGTIGRISGLDPAGPLFNRQSEKVRLDSGDAQFVDVIHTNAITLRKGGFGITTFVGHVDFYPNGGKVQPGCRTNKRHSLRKWRKQFISGIVTYVGCHHLRAVHLYIESIPQKSCRFVAHRCPGGYSAYLAGKCADCQTFGCSDMGYNADKFPARGDMYLKTSDSEPYCVNRTSPK